MREIDPAKTALQAEFKTHRKQCLAFSRQVGASNKVLASQQQCNGSV
jgi:hypothetical protein